MHDELKSHEGTAMITGHSTKPVPVHFPDFEGEITFSSEGRCASLLRISRTLVSSESTSEHLKKSRFP